MGQPVRGIVMVLPGRGDRPGADMEQPWDIVTQSGSQKEYIAYFRRVTGYFLEHLPEDLCPYWDLEFGTGDEEPRDSSSAVIAACGMLEMSKYMNAEEGAYYKSIALKILKQMVDKYGVKSP